MSLSLPDWLRKGVCMSIQLLFFPSSKHGRKGMSAPSKGRQAPSLSIAEALYADIEGHVYTGDKGRLFNRQIVAAMIRGDHEDYHRILLLERHKATREIRRPARIDEVVILSEN